MAKISALILFVFITLSYSFADTYRVDPDTGKVQKVIPAVEERYIDVPDDDVQERIKLLSNAIIADEEEIAKYQQEILDLQGVSSDSVSTKLSIGSKL